MKHDVRVSSMVGYNSGRPGVSLTVGDLEMTMTPAKAREIAFMLLQAAEAGVGDAYLVAFATSAVGLSAEEAARLVDEFRRWRLEHGVDDDY